MAITSRSAGGSADQAPADYIRKQTLVNAERYITPEMKEYETLVLNAEERIREIEGRLFRELCAQIGGAGRAAAGNGPRAGASWTCLASLAESRRAGRATCAPR